VLAVVTTLELDPKRHDYKKPFVEKLSKVAGDYLASSEEAAAFVLMSRPKDWDDRHRPCEENKVAQNTTRKHRGNRR
jgi:hypothetical protein